MNRNDAPPRFQPHIDRTGSGTYRIELKGHVDGRPVSIYTGSSPSSIDRSAPVLTLDGAASGIVGGLAPDIHYFFEFSLDGKICGVAADRRVPLTGAPNFRDLGGYETRTGRRLKWGQVFRSSHLADLEAGDLRLLDRLGIALVCDFRSPAEIDRQPNRLCGVWRPGYLKLPIVHGKFDPAEAVVLIKKNDLDWLTEDFMADMYVKKIDRFPQLWKAFFTHLADQRCRPLVFHCTAGKDRTGVCAALILMLLDVPEETIVYDHALSNQLNAAVMSRIRSEVAQWGVDPDRLEPYLSAPRKAIEALIDHLRTRYGSAAAYLHDHAGIAAQTLAKIRRSLLD